MKQELETFFGYVSVVLLAPVLFVLCCLLHLISWIDSILEV